MALLVHVGSGQAWAQQTAADTAPEAISAEESRFLRNFRELKQPANIELSAMRINQLLALVNELSPAVRELEYNALAAGADVEAAKGALMPQVTVTGQSAYSQGDLPSASRADGRAAVTLAAQYPVYDWGRIAANIRGREQAQASLFARQDLIARQLSIEATSLCLELSKQRALLRANSEYREKINSLVEMINQIVKLDSGRAAELAQSRSRLLQAESAEGLLRSRVRELRIRLERLLGRDQTERCTGIGPSLMEVPEEGTILASIEANPQLQILQAEYQQAVSNVDQIAATRKPQVNLRAEHAPLAASVSDRYQQVVTLSATVPLYDGNTLKNSERAALDRTNAAIERIDQARRQLSSDLRERARAAATNFRRAEELIELLAINDKVRRDFFLQWSELGRRSLFELLAIEQEQQLLQSSYFTALYDGMIGVATVSGSLGELSAPTAPRQ